jgi:hypothetical protein
VTKAADPQAIPVHDTRLSKINITQGSLLDKVNARMPFEMLALYAMPEALLQHVGKSGL